ncbi:MAG: sigma-54 factor interaction domain-containing protein, partial [Planctomycetota bacterium]|nr:sigma-54 factor interaction domain-containing protein [Planctomycetota bacterium]
MPEVGPFSEPALDDRSPYSVVLAATETLLRLSDVFTTQEEVFEAFVEEAGPAGERYVAAIANAQHSVFYHQLQGFYEFAMRHVRPEERDGFCRACGRAFMEPAFEKSLHWVLRMGMGHPGAFQATVVEMMAALIHRFGGEKYVLTCENTSDAITATLTYRRPEALRDYLQAYGLEPERCLRNSVDFIAGTMEAFLSRIVEDFDLSQFHTECDGVTGRYSLPISATARFDYTQLLPTLLNYIEVLQEREEWAREDERLESELIIESDVMRATWNRLRRASRSEEIVLLRGESGTGKSFIARKIHEGSTRRELPFVEVGLTADMGSDSLLQSNLFGHERGAFTGAVEQKRGLFSLADGGTIFLDEIGDASPELQGQLLRVVETGRFRRVGGVEDLHVDVRIILATNRDLERMVEESGFRRDLYYRINVIPIELPPLRARRDEVGALAEFLLARAQAR